MSKRKRKEAQGSKLKAQSNGQKKEDFNPLKWDANAKMAVWVTVIGTIVLWLAATLRWE